MLKTKPPKKATRPRDRVTAKALPRSNRTGATLKRARADFEVEVGSGNVFADIGMPNPEEALAKAELARQINLALEAKNITQTEAGRILGIPQPRVSDLSCGRLVKFSLEKLLDFAKRLGNNIEIRITPSKQPRMKVKILPRAS